MDSCCPGTPSPSSLRLQAPLGPNRGNKGISRGNPPHRLSPARTGKGLPSLLSVITSGTAGKMETDPSILQQYLFRAHAAPPFPFKTFYFFFPFKVTVNLVAVSHQFYLDANFL